MKTNPGAGAFGGYQTTGTLVSEMWLRLVRPYAAKATTSMALIKPVGVQLNAAKLLLSNNTDDLDVYTRLRYGMACRH